LYNSEVTHKAPKRCFVDCSIFIWVNVELTFKSTFDFEFKKNWRDWHLRKL